MRRRLSRYLGGAAASSLEVMFFERGSEAEVREWHVKALLAKNPVRCDRALALEQQSFTLDIISTHRPISGEVLRVQKPGASSTCIV